MKNTELMVNAIRNAKQQCDELSNAIDVANDTDSHPDLVDKLILKTKNKEIQWEEFCNFGNLYYQWNKSKSESVYVRENSVTIYLSGNETRISNTSLFKVISSTANQESRMLDFINSL